MNKNLKIRLLADSGMTLALLLLMSYQLVGEKAHEWIGMAMFLLVIGHHVLNRRWMGNITRGKYTVHRILQTVIVILGSDDDRLHGERYSVVQLYFPVRPDQRGDQSGKEHLYSLCILGISVYGGASGTSLEHDAQNSGKGVSHERRC